MDMNNFPVLQGLASGNPYLKQAIEEDLDYTSTELPDIMRRREGALQAITDAYANDPRANRTTIDAAMHAAAFSPYGALNQEAGKRADIMRAMAGQEQFLLESKIAPQKLLLDYTDKIAQDLENRRKNALSAGARYHTATGTGIKVQSLGNGYAAVNFGDRVEVMQLPDIEAMFKEIGDLQKVYMDKGDPADPDLVMKARRQAESDVANNWGSARRYSPVPTYDPGTTPVQPPMTEIARTPRSVTPTSAKPQIGAPVPPPQDGPTDTTRPDYDEAGAIAIGGKLNDLIARRNAEKDIYKRNALNIEITKLHQMMRASVPGATVSMQGLEDPTGGQMKDTGASEPFPVDRGLQLKQPETQASRDVVGKGWGEQITKAEQEIADFGGMNRRLDEMMALTSKGATFSGPLADVITTMGGYASYLDPDGNLAKKAGSSEEYFAKMAELARQKLKDIGGNDSNTDLLFSLRSSAALTGTVQGRMQTLAALKADVLNSAAEAKEKIDYFNKNGQSLKGYNPIREYPRMTMLAVPVRQPNGALIYDFRPVTFEQFKQKHISKFGNKTSEKDIIKYWKEFIATGGNPT